MVVFIWLTISITGRAIKGLREEKMDWDRYGKKVEGKEAIKLAKVHLFVAGLCFSGALFMLFLLTMQIRIWIIGE